MQKKYLSSVVFGSEMTFTNYPIEAVENSIALMASNV